MRARTVRTTNHLCRILNLFSPPSLRLRSRRLRIWRRTKRRNGPRGQGRGREGRPSIKRGLVGHNATKQDRGESTYPFVVRSARQTRRRRHPWA